MVRIRAALVFGAVLGTLGRAGWAQGPVADAAVREGTLSFDGRATVGDFTGTTTTVSGELKGGSGLSAVRGWVEAPVSTLSTGNGKRDRDLNKSMESGKYPTIRFDLTGVESDPARGDTVPVTLEGRFTIHGVTRAASVTARVVHLPNGLRVRGEIPLNLKDYGIGGLTKMMGMLKMHEEIVVHVDLVFGPAPARQALH